MTNQLVCSWVYVTSMDSLQSFFCGDACEFIGVYIIYWGHCKYKKCYFKKLVQCTTLSLPLGAWQICSSRSSHLSVPSVNRMTGGYELFGLLF